MLYQEDSSFGNFLGEDDDWNKSKKTTFVSKEQLLNYFKDFEVMYYAEKKYIKDSIEEKNKHWHVFEIYAKKVEPIHATSMHINDI